MHYEGKSKKKEMSFGPLMKPTSGRPTGQSIQLKSDLCSRVPLLGLKFCYQMGSAVVLYKGRDPLLKDELKMNTGCRKNHFLLLCNKSDRLCVFE
jgi:hypothetical protein